MIKQVIPRDYCLGCQGCCRFGQQDSVWLPCLLNEEIEGLLKKNFPSSLISGEKKIRSQPHPEENNFTPPLRAGAGFICSFFVPQDNKCKIYAFRPFECQLYPFLINRKDDKIFLAVDLRCPFAQENLKNPKYKKYIQYLTDLFNGSSVIQILKNNPQIIQTYPEVLNLKKLNFNL
jgi:Fe-S-cluster containining protein